MHIGFHVHEIQVPPWLGIPLAGAVIIGAVVLAVVAVRALRSR